MNLIPIDGTSGSGKGTTALLFAESMNMHHIDTGMFYRFATRVFHASEIESNDVSKITSFIVSYLTSSTLIIREWRYFHDGLDITDQLRTPRIAQDIPFIAAMGPIRDQVNTLIRNTVAQSDRPCVVDGRDIGTVVFPDVPIKFWMTADDHTRAVRQQMSYVAKWNTDKSTYDFVLALRQRDQQDMSREIAPLKKADWAIEIDTTHMTPEEVVTFMREKIDMVTLASRSKAFSEAIWRYRSS